MRRVSPKKKAAPAVKRGRPASPQRERVFFRADTSEQATWQAEADRMGIPLSLWIRITLNAAARGTKS